MASTKYDHRDTCAIVGIGNTDFTRNSGRSDLTLAVQATMAALEDAGLTAKDVDGIVRCEHDLVRPSALGDAIGVDNLTFWAETGPGGVAPAAMVGLAVAAIMSGQATTVVVYRSLNGRSGARYGLSREATTEVGGSMTYDEMYLPHGLLTPGQCFAIMARRHMIEFGTTEEQLAHIALACREHANRNPNAQMYGRQLTLDDVMSSRMISDPLKLYDFCLETDGACALVVTSAERARDLKQKPALITAVTQASGPEQQATMMNGVLTRESITRLPSTIAAKLLYQRAGLGPEDIPVAQIYDCFSITAYMQIADYGFCEPGDTGAFVEEGNLLLGGRLPMNTSGGHLSEGYIHGMNHVLEGVRQVRGTSTSQVPGAEVCLVTSAMPPGPSAMILKADR